ncbi:hypothetical protein EB796_015692 [Bugula neritina]|uniref:Uncharacterized protein n=1 Tax=Bugula neritina TaxID=10212 RepID=A0A7J7JIV8_BUGNE|nr:hypothetical protein EB796_015692 [Bugula neritina]
MHSYYNFVIESNILLTYVDYHSLNLLNQVRVSLWSHLSCTASGNNHQQERNPSICYYTFPRPMFPGLCTLYPVYFSNASKRT